MKHPIEIRDPNIDTGAIMTRLEANLHARQAAGTIPPELPEFDLSAIPMPNVQNATLRYHLERANVTYNQGWVKLSLSPSVATQIPILAKLWGLIRQQMHRLILYYVDMAISKQIGFNEHIVGVVNQLAAAQKEIVCLRQKVSDLQAELTELPDSLKKN